MTALTAEYRVLVVDRTGGPYAELERVQLQRCTWVLNGIGRCTFALPSTDAKVREVDLVAREVQVWRKDRLLWWGVPLTWRVRQDVVTFECADLMWYLTRRHVGDADRQNLLANPGFEAGPAGGIPTSWVQGGVGAGNALTLFQKADPATYDPQGGQYVMRLSSGGYVRNAHAQQRYTGPYATQGRQFTLAAWFYIESYTHAPFGERGLMLDLRDPAVLDAAGNPTSRAQFPYPINDDTRLNRWVRAEVSGKYGTDENLPLVVEARLYGVDGVIAWDAVQLVRRERLAGGTSDLANHASVLVQHAQDTAYGHSDLNIGRNCPATGRLVQREYLHDEHENVWECLTELTGMSGGVDMGIEWDATVTPQTRTFRTYFPSKGQLRADRTLELGRNVTSFDWVEDASNVSNSVILLGRGEGAAREEGWAKDTAALGGVTLEEIVTRNKRLPIGMLDDRAAEIVARRKKPVHTARIKTREISGEPLIGVLDVGDTIPVRIDQGRVNVNENYRVVEMSLDPVRDELDLTLNRA